MFYLKIVALATIVIMSTGCAKITDAVTERNVVAQGILEDSQELETLKRRDAERIVALLSDQKFGQLKTNTERLIAESESEADRIAIMVDYYDAQSQIEDYLAEEARRYETQIQGQRTLTRGIKAINDAANREAEYYESSVSDFVNSEFIGVLLEIIETARTSNSVDFEGQAISQQSQKESDILRQQELNSQVQSYQKEFISGQQEIIQKLKQRELDAIERQAEKIQNLIDE